MMDSQTVSFRIRTCADFVGLCFRIESDSKRCMLRQGVTGLRRCEPLWLRVRPDEIEIGIGGVRFFLAGGRLFRLELIEDSVAT